MTDKMVCFLAQGGESTLAIPDDEPLEMEMASWIEYDSSWATSAILPPTEWDIGQSRG